MKGLILFSNGMEDNEALGTIAYLRRSGVSIESVSLEEGIHVLTQYQQTVHADMNYTNVSLDDYDFLVIPGGGYVKRVIDQDIRINSIIKDFHQEGKLIAAICAGPRFLGRLGLLDGLDYTCFPGSEIDMPKGNYLRLSKVVSTHQIITARSAGAVVEFAAEIVKKIQGFVEAKSLIDNILY